MDTSGTSSLIKQVVETVAAVNANKWILFTEKLIIGVIVLLVVIDIVLALNNVKGDTISEVIKRWAYSRYFILSWAWGILAGHLFLTNANPPLEQGVAIPILLTIAVLLFAAGFVVKAINFPVQLGLLILGIVLGYLLWTQSPVTP